MKLLTILCILLTGCASGTMPYKERHVRTSQAIVWEQAPTQFKACQHDSTVESCNP